MFDLVHLRFAQNAQRVHLCTELTAAFWKLEPLGEIGANFSLQLSSRTRFDKINTKKVIAENQCEKHKKSSLALCNDSAYIWQNLSIVMQKCDFKVVYIYIKVI